MAVSTLQLLALFCAATCALAQDASRAVPDPVSSNPVAPSATTPKAKRAHKHMFWIIPDYRTTDLTSLRSPLTRERPGSGLAESLDPGSFMLAGALAGIYQASGTYNQAFGQGVKGYFCRFGTSYGDIVIENFMTEAIFPSLLHQDPRYFRRGQGSTWSRLGSAVGQIFWTRTDSGGRAFNYSEFAGAAVATAISNAYYPDNRTASDNLRNFGVQVGVDAASNVMKEFWPDVYRKFSKRKPGTVNP